MVPSYRVLLLAVLLLTVAGCLAGQALLADEPAEAPGRLDAEAVFERVDSNGDGQITADEVQGGRRRLFDRLLARSDADKNGSLNRQEFVAGLRDEQAAGPRGVAGDGRRPAAADAGEMLRRLDSDGDGKLIADELPEPLRERFDRLLERFDRNGSGGLELEELGAAQGIFRRLAGRTGTPGQRPMPDGLFGVLDVDADGRLSPDEIAAAAENLGKLDRDGDGTLSRREAMAAGRAGAAGTERPDPARLVSRLMQADKDRDGKLTQEELPRFLQRNFSRLDADSDGLVDREELQQAAEWVGRRIERRSEKQPEKARGNES